jgi:hypothetical protein
MLGSASGFARAVESIQQRDTALTRTVSQTKRVMLDVRNGLRTASDNQCAVLRASASRR